MSVYWTLPHVCNWKYSLGHGVTYYQIIIPSIHLSNYLFILNIRIRPKTKPRSFTSNYILFSRKVSKRRTRSIKLFVDTNLQKGSLKIPRNSWDLRTKLTVGYTVISWSIWKNFATNTIISSREMLSNRSCLK